MWKWFPKLSYFYIYTIKEYLSWKAFHYKGNPEREMEGKALPPLVSLSRLTEVKQAYCRAHTHFFVVTT